ncbi:MAG: hypothetical protein JXA06_04020 [Bacteroidetes bacterium]|nr:hypothetical protein [Bacteroidota bacterium]
MKAAFLFLFILTVIVFDSYSQETTLRLPTSDNTSGFNVTKEDNTSVFKVDGSGRMSGDGSGLSNVRAGVKYIQGNQSVYFHEGMIPGLNLYEAQIMREVTINCPGPGIILAMAGGYLDWESADEDLVRIWFHPHPTVSPDNWETPDFHNLIIVSDYQCADSSDQYTSWSHSKVYTVSGAGNFTVRCCGDKPFTTSKVLVGDVRMQLMFFPTGGTGWASFRIATSDIPEDIKSDPVNANTIDGSSPLNRQDKPAINDASRINKLENEIEVLKQKINALLEKK